MKGIGILFCGGLACSAACAIAQTQQQKPPIAVYWVSAETASGMAMGSGGMSAAAMMMDGGMDSARRNLLLQLGSQQSASGEPAASHQIPATLKMGSALPLVTPKNPPPVTEPREGPPEDYPKPKGRMLIYWGCGEQTRSGQPLVIDFAKMASGQAWPAGLFSLHLTLQRPPAPGRNRSYGDWPNKEDATRVPADASLLGDHAVKGNYSPEIRFAVDAKHDFLAPVALDTSAKTPGGGVIARWQAIPNATGYFATVMSAAAGGNDIVMWSSSETKVFGDTLLTWLPNADVARLIKEKVVMPPQTTECVVPAAVASAGEGGMMRFIAYGDELNLAHPPRPQNPKEVWEPLWAVKLRQKSTLTTLLGMEAAPTKGRRAGKRNADANAEGRGEPAGETKGESSGETPGDAAVKEGVKALRGVFGF